MNTTSEEESESLAIEANLILSIVSQEQICIFGNYVVLAALIVVLISIIIFIIMHIHLGKQKHTVTEPERGAGAMKT